MTETWTYYDANTIQITGDLTAKYWAGQLLKVTQDGSDKFFKVEAVSLVSGNTRLTVNGGGVFTLTDQVITDHAYSIQAAPQGVPYGCNFDGHVLISLLTTRGDVPIRGETGWIRRAKGSQYSIFSMGAVEPDWTTLTALLDSIGATPDHILSRGAETWGTNPLKALITALSNDVTQADGKYIATDKIRARDGDGLSLQDDGGNGVLIPDGGGMAFPRTVGDKISLFDSRLGATLGYCLGIEPNTMYFKSFGMFRWYVNANADGGTSDRMELSGNNLWIAGDCSALTFTDRCKFPPEVIDALSAIRQIKGDGKGELDHSSLPDYILVRTQKDIFEERDVLDEKTGKPKLDETGQKIIEQVKIGEEIEEGRDLGGTVSLLIKAVQELEAVVKAQAAEITELKRGAKK